MTDNDLKVVAGAIASMMAKAGNVQPPDINMSNGTNLVSRFALAGNVALFQVTTPFGDSVNVTVSRAGGMFGD